MSKSDYKKSSYLLDLLLDIVIKVYPNQSFTLKIDFEDGKELIGGILPSKS